MRDKTQYISYLCGKYARRHGTAVVNGRITGRLSNGTDVRKINENIYYEY